MKEQIILNPISDLIKSCINDTEIKLKIAVPFISSFARKIIDNNTVENVSDKRLITKFDERNINTFDLPTLEYLIDCGFKICYNNAIHLKLYITDSNTFITSSNLTNGGFENNIELTVNVNSENFEKCEEIFEDLWQKSKLNKITKNLINENQDKYAVLKKRQKFEKTKITAVTENFSVGLLDIQLLVDEIFNATKDYSWHLKKAYNANKLRNQTKIALINKPFDKTLFYSPIGHQKRSKNLYYDFVYGAESKLAGTGLREAQFKAVFEHSDFKKVINFIFPESLGLEPWNLSDNKSLFDFCNGLFDFKIPQYSEAIPIRLASYFYPEFFMPVFKLNHLQKVCNALGIRTEAKTKGEKLYAFNLFLKNKMRDIPVNNYIKSSMIYQMLYAVELHKRIENGEDFELIKKSYNKQWIRNYIEEGKVILESIKALGKEKLQQST